MSKDKNLFELFPEYTEEEIINAFNELTVNVKEEKSYPWGDTETNLASIEKAYNE